MSRTEAPRRLLALDLDGTLVRDDGTVAEIDRAAIARARRAGVHVTLATGRLAPSAVALARSIGLETPLLCADGAALVCPRTHAVLETESIGIAAVRAFLAVLTAHDLAPFVCLADVILGDADGLDLSPFVAGWSAEIAFRAEVRARAGAVMALGLGPRERVEAASAALNGSLGPEVAITDFGLGPGAPWALRAQPAGASKGEALARLAGMLGVPREGVAAVGDWYNDLSMLAWAGRSFAMGQSPAAVRGAAREVLEATSKEGGGVAEVVNRWLGR